MTPPSRFFVFRQFHSRSITTFGWFNIWKAWKCHSLRMKIAGWLLGQTHVLGRHQVTELSEVSLYTWPPICQTKWSNLWKEILFWQEFWGWIKSDCPLTFGKRLFVGSPTPPMELVNFLQTSWDWLGILFSQNQPSSIFNIISCKRCMIFYFYINELSKCHLLFQSHPSNPTHVFIFTSFSTISFLQTKKSSSPTKCDRLGKLWISP